MSIAPIGYSATKCENNTFYERIDNIELGWKVVEVALKALAFIAYFCTVVLPIHDLYVKFQNITSLGFILHSFSLGFLNIRTLMTRSLNTIGCENHKHVRAFITNKKNMNATRFPLYKTLLQAAKKSTHISKLILTQENFKTKDELLQNLPERENLRKIAIPIAIKVLNFFRHFVTIIIDFDANLIEYYDPIGVTPIMYPNTPIWSRECPQKNLTLSELLCSLKIKYKINTLVANSVIHQQDYINCSYFVFDRIYQRTIEHKSIDVANLDPLSSNKIIHMLT